ncbi:MAG: polysaccharide deacetylase family protein [Phycisphaerae bacterium]|nr:polysaccharide deacetylase family protein [Phycisphaerae bacterium]
MNIAFRSSPMATASTPEQAFSNVRSRRDAQQAGATRTIGAISIDMDTLSDYARGYGFQSHLAADPVYTHGLVRFLEILAKHDIRATLFVIARDAMVPAHAAILRHAIEAGHEIANHTMTHPRRLSALSDSGRRREIVEAHDTLCELAGRRIVGFRAPCYDICQKTLRTLERLDYQYDSSVHPSMIAPVIDLAVLIKSRFRKWDVRPGSYWRLLSPLRPHRIRQQGILELPLSALPYSRLPFYGTWVQSTGMTVFRKSLSWLRRFSLPLNFHFHAVELVGLNDTGVDPRFAVHPGMKRDVERRLADVDEMLSAFTVGYELNTLESMALRFERSLK